MLWLEGNGLGKIEGLEHQTQLRTLYLHENLISKIEGLDTLTALDTLNLSQNQITRVENLEHLQALTVRGSVTWDLRRHSRRPVGCGCLSLTWSVVLFVPWHVCPCRQSLALKGNYLVTAEDMEHVLTLPNLSVLDLQSNRLTDVGVVDALAQMPELKVLYLQGNDVVKHIKQYRKTLIFRCRKLKYLDDRPVFDDERRRVDAWGRALDASNGDFKVAQEAEREELEAIRREKKERDERNFLYFEQMMVDGRRKRKEEEEAAAAKTAKENGTERPNESPEQQQNGDDVSVFSGEKIVPVQDCTFLQQEREKRWAAVVHAPDGVSRRSSSNQDEEQQHQRQASTRAKREEAGLSQAIPVDTRRLEVLHQCATVGSGLHSSKDPFVDASFATEDGAAAAERRQEVVNETARANVQELPATTPAVAVVSRGGDDRASDFIPAATRVVTCDTSVFLCEPTSSDGHHEPHAGAFPPPLMPPPAPARLSTLMETATDQSTPLQSLPVAAVPAAPAIHTNVNELD